MLRFTRTLPARVCACILLLTLLFMIPVQAKAMRPVALQLRWGHQFQFAGYYAALWQGYYEEEGLDVKIRSAFDTGQVLDAPTEVMAGRAQFGVGAANLLIAEDQGARLKLVASIFQRSAVTYCTLRGDEANSVFALSQMHLARRPGDLLDLELQALLFSEGIDPHAGKKTLLTRDFTLDDLLSGRFDVVPEFLGQITYEASERGVDLHTIHPAEYGVDFYGDTLFTSEALADAEPDLVERFRRASIRGWQYALEHSDEVAMRISAETPEPDGASMNQAERLRFNRFQAEQVMGLTHYPIVEIGNINPSRWIKMATAMERLDMIETVPDIDQLIFDYDKVKMSRLEETKSNIALGLGSLLAILTLVFMVYLKRRNSLLQNEVDIRHEAERQLILSNSRYETIFRSSVLGITITDYAGRIQHVNDAWCRMTGYTAEELCRMNIQDLIAQESSGIDDKQLEDLRTGKISSYALEKKYLRKPAADDGRPFFHGRMVLTQIWDMTTDSYLTMSMVTDITGDVLSTEAARRSEARFRRIIGQVAKELVWNSSMEAAPDSGLPMNLEAINMELERLFTRELEANRRKDALIRYQARMSAMGEMIGNIAHQWRQPLNTLKLVLLNLRETDPASDYARQAFDRADGLIRRMSDTIDDFRYFSKPQREPSSFTVAGATRGVLGLMDENLRIAGITVETDIEGLPELYGLENHLSHALFNLFSNAIDVLKKLPPDQTRVIRLSGRCSGDVLQLAVEDTGPGIAKSHEAHIFDMYFTTKASEGGTGLGLYMVKEIIESSFGGTIRYVPVPSGCRFEIELPIRKAGEAHESLR